MGHVVGKWIIGCGVDSGCSTAIVWRSKVAGHRGGADKSGGEQRLCPFI